MRPVAMATLLVALTVLATPAAWALSQCPGIRDVDGETKVDLVGSGACTGSACPAGPGSLVDAIAGPLCSLGFLPGECGRCECCRARTVDLFTGTDLQFIGPDPNAFCGLGGRGRPMGEAALCLLRDLADPALAPSTGGPGIHLERSASLGIGNVSVRQHVGFLDFDLPARRVRGFHAVSVCAPVLGCISNQTQRFTATLQQVVGPAGDCGDYDFRTPWILRVDTEQIEHNVGLELPPIPIYTPVGPIDVKPLFSYELNLEAVTSPWANGNVSTAINLGPCIVSNLYDVVDAGGGVFASVVAAQNSGILGFGWDARLGLGTRDPDPAGMVWSPPVMMFPPRPDFDFSIARAADEKRPTGRFHTGIDVTYPLGDLAGSFVVPPLDLVKAEVFVRSSLDAAFVSQFNLGVDEFLPNKIPDCIQPALTTLHMQSAVDALAQVGVTAGVDIELELDLGFTSKTFSFNPKVNVIAPQLVPSSPVVGPEASAELNPGTSPPATVQYSQFASFSGGAEDGRAFVNACLVQPPPPQELPTPSIEPGDPMDLITPDEFPCNICLYFPGFVTQACLPKPGVPADYQCDLAINGMPCTDPNCQNVAITPPVAVNLKTVVFPVSQAGLPSGQQWMCNAFEKFGCFDLCRYDPSAAQPLTLTQSAVTTIGTRCRDATGGSDPSREGTSCSNAGECDDGNPCTEDQCLLEGEFKVCRITQSQGACDDGLFCDGADSCALGICGAHAGNPCGGSGCCSEQTNACGASCPRTPCEGRNAGDPCDDGSPCTVDDRCVSGAGGGLDCRGTAALSCPGTTCLAGICTDVDGAAQCAGVPSGFCPPECGDGGLDPGEDCDGTSDAACPGHCQPDCSCPPPGKMNGDPCTTAGECASQQCADGVCCDSACTGAQQQCNLPGQQGTCATLAVPVPVLSLGALLAALGLLVAIAAVALRRARGHFAAAGAAEKSTMRRSSGSSSWRGPRPSPGSTVA